MTVALVLTLAWGALAFGAVYPWAYMPLGIACVAIGASGLLRGRREAEGGRRKAEGGRREAEGGRRKAGGGRREAEGGRRTGGGGRRQAEGGRRTAGVNRPLAAGLALVALAIVVQLAPLPHETLMRLSPATDAFLQRYDLQYAALMQSEALRAGSGAEAPPHGGPEGPPYSRSHAMSIDPAQTRLGLALLAVFAIFLLGLARGLTSRGVRRLAPPLVALGVVLALAGIIQQASFNGKIYGFWVPEAGIRAFAPGGGTFGPFVNRNHFAGWMLMALALGLGYFCALVGRGMRGVKPELRNRVLWFASPDANKVILAGFGLLVMGLSLVMTLSRSGITCFAIALALTGLAVARRQAKRSRRAVLATYVLFLGVLAIGWAGLDAVAARFAQAGIDLQFRMAAWNDALHIFRDFPAFGSGVNTFGTAMAVYQTSNPGVRLMEAHNDYAQLLAEGGLLVTSCALVLLLLFIREVRRRFRQDTDDQMTYWIRAGAVTGLVAIGLQEIVEFSLQMPGNAALFCTLMAIAAGKLPHRPKASFGLREHPRL